MARQLQSQGFARISVKIPPTHGSVWRTWRIIGEGARKVSKLNIKEVNGRINIISGVKEYVHLAGPAELNTTQRAVYEALLSIAIHAARASGFDVPLSESAKLQIYHYFDGDKTLRSADTGGGWAATDAPAAWGCPEHIDSGVLTVVLSDAPGLEVFDQLAGAWADSGDTAPDWLNEALPATVLVGHTLEIASEGAYKAALHRVRQTERTSVVLKLHANGTAWIPAAGCTVADNLQTFERERPSVNPQPDSLRPSATAGSLITVDNRSVTTQICPEYTGIFSEDMANDSMRLPPVQIRGPLLHSAEHPVLLDPYFYLWILQSRFDSLRLTLPRELRERILEMLPTNWRATTVAEVIGKLSEQMGEANTGRVKLVLAGRLFGMADGAQVLTQLAPEVFTTSIVQGLGFARYDEPSTELQRGPKVNLRFINYDGIETFFRISVRKPLVGLMYAYCNRIGISINAVFFMFDGSRIRGSATPEELDMEEGDVIDVLLDQCGD